MAGERVGEDVPLMNGSEDTVVMPQLQRLKSERERVDKGWT